MKHLSLRVALIGFFLIGALTLQAAELASAKVLSVSGSVTLYSGDAERPLQAGDILHQGDSVSSSQLSGAKLVFSNGSIITVEPNTSLTLREMKQESFAGGKSYEELEADPSQSQTMLELNYGKVKGEVKKLANGSNFNVETPLGTAAIRGTVFWIELIYNAEAGQLELRVMNIKGEVDLMTKFAGAMEFKGGAASMGYDSRAETTRVSNIPNQHIIIMHLSKEDPNYDEIVDVLTNYFPTGGRAPRIITLPTPELTPEDPGVIVVSPEIELPTPD
ncbi:FecR family protein [Coraliomargarita parva]|uniref:FecR family protein n=1 Tax=Coraliomargarita parva TaxID=3014050 RepID=UPI0022B477C4|nr:FecR family protein [Coraliomargarita parva]